MIVKDFEADEADSILCDLPTILLADPPSLDREMRPTIKDDKLVEAEDIDISEAIIKLLSSPNIASKPGDDDAVLKMMIT